MAGLPAPPPAAGSRLAWPKGWRARYALYSLGASFSCQRTTSPARLAKGTGVPGAVAFLRLCRWDRIAPSPLSLEESPGGAVRNDAQPDAAVRREELRPSFLGHCGDLRVGVEEAGERELFRVRRCLPHEPVGVRVPHPQQAEPEY